ncbi:MAG TPA: hypothetical protein VLX44_16940 [Xanthobacteraceae bacterium]|nr:hypothetical protein [Xanthobacteraceae bacterium]
MHEMIARLNLEHFRKLLASETDQPKRRTLLRLLAEEEAKLASSVQPPEVQPPEDRNRASGLRAASEQA